MVVSILAFLAGIVVGYLVRLHHENQDLIEECRICERKEEKILELEKELFRYKRWTEKVIEKYREKHPEED